MASSSSSPALSYALLFSNFRAHCLFSDHSALVLHPSGGRLSSPLECFTYFSPSGGTHRQLLRHASPRQDLREKLMLSLHFRNMFSDVPVVGLPSLFPADTLSISLHRNTQAHWRAQDVSCNGDCFSLRSVEDNAWLSLHPSRFLFKVEFKTLLEGKTTRWFDEERGVMKSGTLGAVPKTCFQYVSVSQVFSICEYPSRWAAPLFLLWQAVLQSQGQHQAPVREPLFPLQLTRFFSGISPSSLSSRAESYRGINFAFISNTDELVTELPCRKTKQPEQSEGRLGVKSDARLRQLFFNQNEHSLKSSERVSESSASEGEKFEGWQEDTVMPTPHNVYGSFKSANVALLWTESSTIRQTGSPRELQVLVHADDSVLLGNGEVFEHWTRNQQDSRLRFFTMEAVPPLFRNASHQYSLSGDVNTACSLFLQPFHPHSPHLSGSNFSAPQSKNPAIPKGAGPADEEVVCESVNPGLGHFTAFRNRSIKVIFEDRTVLRLSEGQTEARVLTRSGDSLSVPLSNPVGFQKHVSAAQDFLVYAYASPAERVQAQLAAHSREVLVQLELDKIKRSLLLQKCGRSLGGSSLPFPPLPLKPGSSLPENISPNSTFERPPPQEILVTPKRFEFTGGKEESFESAISAVLSVSEAGEPIAPHEESKSRGEEGSSSSLSEERSFSQVVMGYDMGVPESPGGVDFQGINAAVKAHLERSERQLAECRATLQSLEEKKTL